MSNRESIQQTVATLTANAVSDIERLQDFHVFTGHAYDRYAKMVEAGHLKEHVTNSRTNTAIDAPALASVLVAYLNTELPRVILYEIVSRAEAFLFEFFEELLYANPHALSQKKHVDVEDILACDHFAAVMTMLVHRELADLKYKGVGEWFAFLSKIIRLPEATPDRVARLAEIKASRDVVAHNGGVVNDVYLRKAGPLARAAEGAVIPVDRPYVYDAADFLKEFMRRLGTEAANRLAPAA